MTDHQDEPDSSIDADSNGHLAVALFGGVILLILVIIYALATAA